MHNKPSLQCYLLLLAIGIVWGGQFLFNAQAVETFQPTTIAAARALLGAITLSILSCFIPESTSVRPKGRAPISKLLVAIAFFESLLPLFLIAWGQQHVSSSVTAVMVGSVPVLTLLLSVFMSQHSHFTPFSAVSVLLGFLGIVVLVNPSAGGFTLDGLVYQLAILLGALGFAVGLNLLERTPQGAPIRTARNILWLAAVPLVLAALILDQPWHVHWNAAAVGALLVLGILGSGIAYLMYATLTQRSGSVFTSLSNFIVPLVGVALGVTVRGESFGARQGWALGLIIAALAVNELRHFIKPRQVG